MTITIDVSILCAVVVAFCAVITATCAVINTAKK